MLAKLQADKVALKAIKSVTAKIAKKALLLPEYAPYVDGVLAADAGGDDLVLVTAMVWRFDVGDWPGALDAAAYALRHRLTLPEGFSRDLPTLVLESVADAALAQCQDGEVEEGMPAALDRALTLTDGADMHDEVRAKALKAAGLMAMSTDPTGALGRLREAMRLDRRVGVATVISRLEKQLAKAETTADMPPTAAPDGASAVGD
jgi:hypothetical protein